MPTQPAREALTLRELTLPNPELLALLRAALDNGAPFSFSAQGVSMHPFLHGGDVLLLQPLAGKKPALGDVVAYIQPGSGRLLVHRVVGWRAGVCLIQADNCWPPRADEVPPHAVLGCVAGARRAGRPVRLGLGAERALIARLSRAGLLRRALVLYWQVSTYLFGSEAEGENVMEKPVSPGLKITFTLHAAAALLFGLLLLLAPQAWSGLSGRPMQGHELYRLLGAALLALGGSSALAARAKSWQAARIPALAHALFGLLGGGVVLYYLVFWRFPLLYWLPFALLTGFGAAFAFFSFRKK